ncbi:MAG: prephenate dehydratase [Gammaproteobacteria bacterium RIFCSPHIGHO2_12_FULL_41_15]|nr:MAG: prephenate dehydratase [Gammaproteobacteria bacterium RIFCSPHIGHO2_12_FULL_41_15]
MENSTGGVVLETIYALAKYRCTIQDLFFIMVEQSLIAKQGLTLDKISAIYSHHQALRQCKLYLATHFSKIPRIETADTALAAKQLYIGEIPETAAVICNKICADIYNLQLMAIGINDLKDNQTQFIAATPFKENT